MKLSTFAPGIGPEAAANKTAPIGSAAAVAPSPSVTDPNAGPAFASTTPAPNSAAGGSGTLHGAGGGGVASAPVRPSRTGTTAHGAQVFVDPGDDSVSVPMTGPSRKTLVAGAMGIAVVSLAIGAVGAWRAVKASRPQTTVAPPLPEQENAVALLEAPRSLPRLNDPAVQRTGNGRANGGRNSGSNAAGNNGSGAGAGNTAAVDNAGAGSGSPSNNGSGAGASAGSSGSGNGAGASASNGSGSSGASGTQASAGGASAGSTRPSGNGSSGSSAGSGNGSGSSGSSGSSSASNGSSAGSGSAGSGSANSAIEGSGLGGPRAPAQSGYVEGEATDATGTLDPAAFTFVYRHFRTQISSCHSSVTRGGQVVAGIMRVRVRIGTDGRVVRTSVAENTTGSAPLATCVQNQIRTWRYPSPEGGEVEMEYRLGFGN